MKLDAHRVRGNGHDIHLGRIDFNVLRLMIEAPGKVFSRDELIGAAWLPNIHVGARTVDVHISRIRRALENGLARQRHSHRQVGRLLAREAGRLKSVIERGAALFLLRAVLPL